MFVQPDWWEVTRAGVGTNRYGYAGGDAVNASDPGGHGFDHEKPEPGPEAPGAPRGTSVSDKDGNDRSRPLTSFDRFVAGIFGWNVDALAAYHAGGWKGGTTFHQFEKLYAELGLGACCSFHQGQQPRNYARPILQFPFKGKLTVTASVLASPILKEIWYTPGFQDVLLGLLAISQRDQVEVGMVLYRNPVDGTIYNALGNYVKGGSTFVDLDLFGAVGHVHTHWARMDDKGVRNNPFPSDGDLQGAETFGVPGMVVDWNGVVHGYGY